MVQVINRGGKFGTRLGSAIGSSLAEAIPKEVDRHRLSQGLQNFEKDSANLSPMQQLTRLASIPGALNHPQLIQSFGELAKQQAKGNALKNQNENRPSPFPVNKTNKKSESEIPSITQEKPLEEIQEGYIPPTEQEIYKQAGDAYNENPALFGNEPQKAIEFARNKAAQDEKINQAYQKKHENLTAIQDNVVNRLRNHSEKLEVKIPANVYSDIEDKAIQSTKPKNRGGDGLTEQQSMKKYGKELDEISRQYSAIEGLGNWGITGRKAKETLTNIKTIQKDFEKRNDTRNLADKLIYENKLSPQVAYSLAEPIHRDPKLNEAISKIPQIYRSVPVLHGYKSYPVPREYIEDKTLDISKKIAPFLGNKGSPLAVGYVLEKKGYDPSVWIDYLTKHADELGLTSLQTDQMKKPGSFTGTLNDWWLSEWTGLEE